MRLVMKMAAVSAICLFLLCCSAISSADSEVCNVVGERGKSVTLPLVNVWGKSESLRWHYQNELIFYKKGSTVRIQNKGELSANGSLLLTNVDEVDKGSYKPEIHDENGKLKGTLLPIHLCVMDGPPTPKVGFKCSAPSVTFTCGVQAQLAKDLSFEWLQDDKVLPKDKSTTLKQTAHKVETSFFRCKVSNRVSSALSAPVKHNCATNKIIFPEKLLGINTWIFVGAGGGVVLVLMIIIIVCCICAKRKKSMRLKDERELRLAWTSEAQQQQQQQQHQQHPDQHHHHQKQPAGHTGPRQHRSKQPREQRRPRAPGDPGAQPQPSPRRPAQAPRPPGKYDEEQPPPLPQPRKKAGKIP